jgi:metal-responsive CopG/Arc/MetJ family transcriptional regulator
MEPQIFKAVRLPRTIVNRIERITKEEGSTFSQFVRTAVMYKLNERKKVAA